MDAKVLNPDAPDDEAVDVLIEEEKIEDGDTVLIEADAPTQAKPQSSDAPEVGLADLQKQLEDHKKDKEAARGREAAAVADAARARQEAEAARAQVQDVEKSALDTQIESASKDIDRLTADWEAAQNAGDYAKAATINRDLARASAKLDRLETDKENFATRRPAVQHQPQHQVQVDPFEQALQSFPVGSRPWLRNHPECITEPSKYHRMVAAHHEVVAEGIAAETPEYFAKVEERLGYRQPPAADPPPVQQQQRPPAQRASYAAPVSRSAPNAPANGSTIRLSPSQREAARASGITDAEYARELVKLQRSGDIPVTH